MATTRVAAVKGLWTSPSFLSAPLGALQFADNCVISEPDLVEPRRGFAYVPHGFGTSLDVSSALFSFQGTVLVQYGQKLAHDTGVIFSDYAGTNAPPDPTVLRMQALEAGGNFYYTSTEGIKKLDIPSSSPVLAGTPRGPAPTGRQNPTWVTGNPDAGWLNRDAQTAYIATWVRFDTDGTEHEGQPGSAFYVANPPDVLVGGSFPNTIQKAVGSDVAEVFVEAGHGLKVGDAIDVTYSAPTADFPNGIKTVSALGTIIGGLDPLHVFQFVDSSVNGGPGTMCPGGSYGTIFKNVSVSVDLAPGIDTTYTIRVYRAYQSASYTTPPRFQFYLDQEHAIDTSDVAARVYTYTDETPDSLLQDPLYTNTDDGEPPDSSLQNDNSEPPYATDLCLFDSRQWGANYHELQTFNLSLLGVGAPNGLQVGDTITIAGVTYTAVVSGGIASDTDFELFTVTQTGSAGLAVQQTAESLALTVTKYTGSDVNCYYTSGVDDIPGQMLIRGRNPSTAQFTVYASRTSAWGPVLTVGSPGALTSSANAATNGLWYSKQNQSEAVPLLNRLSVGPENCRVLRIQAVRDKLFVFTDIAGIWVISNKYPYENVDPLTKTAVLVSPDTLVNFNDALFALTTQGVAKIDASGPQIISIPIETDIRRLFGTGLATLKTSAVAVGYESSRKYILAMPTDPPDSYNTQAFVYDVVTKSWTRWTKPISALVVVPQTDYLYIGAPTINFVSKERKNFDRTDYADEDFTVTITAADGLAVTVDDASEIEAGDLLYVDPVQNSLVIEVNANILTMQQTVSWTLGAATVYPGIDNKVVYTPMFSGLPEAWKHYRETSFHFKTPAFSLGNALFSSDLNPEEQEVAIALGGFGDPDWERFPWEQPGGPKNKRVYNPAGCQRVGYLSVGFHIQQAWNQWSLAGYTPIYEPGSERETTK